MITLQDLQQQSTQVGGAASASASASASGVSYGALGFFRSSTPLRPTLDLFPSSFGSLKRLDLKSGAIHYKDTYTGCKSGCEEEGKMSRHGKSPKLDLRLNLSPPRVNPAEEESPKQATTTTTSPPSSCVSSENSESNNSPGTTSMTLAGCPRCLMYVMVSVEEPKCPKCKSNVLIDFPDNNINKSTKKN